MLSFENILGVHERAMEVRSQRAQLLSSNLANIDTPNYRARDLDFKSAFASISTRQKGQGKGVHRLDTPHDLHLDAQAAQFDHSILYRTPMQRSIDGNTVEQQIEIAEFLDNAMHMQASIDFIGGKFRSLKTVIKGE